METQSLFTILVKVLVIILLVMYLFIGVLMTRQIFLMNKAIKTKLAGLLNCFALAHTILILGVLIFAIAA